MENSSTQSSLDAISDFLAISDNIGTAGQPSSEQFTLIREAQYEMVVNLRPHADSLPDEQARVESEGMEYVSLPVEWNAPTIEDADRFFALMQANEGRRVFIHCARNMRVSALIYLYRALRQKVAVEIAERDLHRVWIPNPIWQAFIERVSARYSVQPSDADRSRE